ncbi:MAG: hypothetical protein H7Z40_04165 [Phycisphaerae bacterium]|nr:hypothetical protein [Gemmatimonadaceae bacterium]
MRDAGSISIPTKLLATGVACALAVVVCGTAASVVVASEATNKLTSITDTRKHYAARRNAADAFRDHGATALLIDSLLAPLGPLPRATASDVAAITTLNSVRNPGSPVWDVAASVGTPGDLPKFRPRQSPLAGWIDSANTEWLAGAAADTASAWLPIFRRFARSQPQPALWGYRAGLPGVRDFRDLPIRSFGTMRTLFAMNEGAGVLALRNKRYEEAAERALENISASRHFIEQPILFDALVGRIQFNSGIHLLMLAAERRGDSLTLHMARRLDSASKRSFPGPRHLTVDETDASAHAAEKVVGNRALHPAYRIEAMASIILGGCRNTPEVVLGFKGSRRESLERAVQSVSDIPRGKELARQYARFLDYASSSEHAEREPPRGSILDRSELMKLFSWVVPPGVRARASLCLEQG